MRTQLTKSTNQKSVGRRRASNIPLRRKLLYSLVLVLGFFGFLELSLRTVGWGEPPVVGQLRFGYDTGIPIYDSDGIEQEGNVFVDAPLFEPDAELFWRPIANTPFTGPRGFRKPEPDAQPAAGSVTVAVMGGSCSFLGQHPYPAILPQLLKPSAPHLVRVYNASCPGYSTQQGVAQLARVARLDPQVVIVYFGWNDHWNSLNGCSDRELFERTELARRAQSIFDSYHTYWLAHSLVGNRTPQGRPKSISVRVPLDNYEENLRTMAERFSEWNCKAVFVTAPSGFVAGDVPQWAYEFFANYYQMAPQQVADIPKTHDLYNETIRRAIGSFEHCTVCDLDRAFANEQSHFRSDRIHLSEAGHQRAAKLVADSILQFNELGLKATTN